MTRRVAFVGVVTMLVIAFITTLDVLLRWLFDNPINGLNEIVGMGMAVAVAATLPAGASQRVNLTIDVLAAKLPIRMLGLAESCGEPGAAGVLCAARLADRHLRRQLQSRAAETVYVHLPLAPFIWVVAGFLVVSAVVQVVNVFVAVRYALSGIVDPTGWSIGQDGTAPPPARAVATASLPRVFWVGLALLAGLVALLAGFDAVEPALSSWVRPIREPSPSSFCWCCGCCCCCTCRSRW